MGCVFVSLSTERKGSHEEHPVNQQGDRAPLPAYHPAWVSLAAYPPPAVKPTETNFSSMVIQGWKPAWNFSFLSKKIQIYSFLYHYNFRFLFFFFNFLTFWFCGLDYRNFQCLLLLSIYWSGNMPHNNIKRRCYLMGSCDYFIKWEILS